MISFNSNTCKSIEENVLTIVSTLLCEMHVKYFSFFKMNGILILKLPVI